MIQGTFWPLVYMAVSPVLFLALAGSQEAAGYILGKRTEQLGCFYQNVNKTDSNATNSDAHTLWNQDSATGYQINEAVAFEFTDLLEDDIVCYNTNYSAVIGYSQVYRNTAYVWNETEYDEELSFHIYTRETNYLIPESATYVSDTEVIKYDDLSSSVFRMPSEQNSNDSNINDLDNPSTDTAIAFSCKNSDDQNGLERKDEKTVMSPFAAVARTERSFVPITT